MNDMIKAEHYHIRHTSSLVILIICSVLIAVMPLADATGYYDSFKDVSGTGYFGLYISGGVGITSVLLPFLMIFMTAYHEDKWYMSGFVDFMDIYHMRKFKIIISRVFAVGVPFTSCVIFMMCVVLTIFTIKNGFTDLIVGNLFRGNVLIRILILWITNLHLSTVVIIVAHLFSSAKKAAIFTSLFYFVRGFLNLFMGVPKLIQYFDPINLQKFAFEGGDNTQLFLWLVASVICLTVDVAILCLIYYLMKRLKYEKNI